MLHLLEVPVHRKIHVSANREKKLVLVVGLPQTTITSEKSASSLFVATFFAITSSNFMKTKNWCSKNPSLALNCFGHLVISKPNPSITDCFQNSIYFTVSQSGQTGSEDCLFLDITVPAGLSAQAKKPVMIWIHGGGYYAGTGSSYLGAPITTYADVIIVTINYRLGIMGFLSDGEGLNFSQSWSFKHIVNRARMGQIYDGQVWCSWIKTESGRGKHQILPLLISRITHYHGQFNTDMCIRRVLVMG